MTRALAQHFTATDTLPEGRASSIAQGPLKRQHSPTTSLLNLRLHQRVLELQYPNVLRSLSRLPPDMFVCLVAIGRTQHLTVTSDSAKLTIMTLVLHKAIGTSRGGTTIIDPAPHAP